VTLPESILDLYLSDLHLPDGRTNLVHLEYLLDVWIPRATRRIVIAGDGGEGYLCPEAEAVMAYRIFLEQIAYRARAGVSVYVVAGNHDDRVCRILRESDMELPPVIVHGELALDEGQLVVVHGHEWSAERLLYRGLKWVGFRGSRLAGVIAERWLRRGGSRSQDLARYRAASRARALTGPPGTVVWYGHTHVAEVERHIGDRVTVDLGAFLEQVGVVHLDGRVELLPCRA